MYLRPQDTEQQQQQREQQQQRATTTTAASGNIKGFAKVDHHIRSKRGEGAALGARKILMKAIVAKPRSKIMLHSHASNPASPTRLTAVATVIFSITCFIV